MFGGSGDLGGDVAQEGDDEGTFLARRSEDEDTGNAVRRITDGWR